MLEFSWQLALLTELNRRHAPLIVFIWHFIVLQLHCKMKDYFLV